MAILLDGADLAKKSEPRIRKMADLLNEQKADIPTLATILVGSDPASRTYVRMKQNACMRVGIGSRAIHLDTRFSTSSVIQIINELNSDPAINGILLQHPVPDSVDERKCFDTIDAAKDVDGVTTTNFGYMSMGMPAWGSCTPLGIMRLLRQHHIELKGIRAVVVGRSAILGKPMAMMLLNANATVTLCHSHTQNLAQEVQRAELIVAAVGIPNFIRADWIADDAVVVDAGFHPQLRVGDVELAPVRERCRAYTPVPGGVGPMTINTLLLQTAQSALKANKLKLDEPLI
ncbi:MAG: tetrahydrofolate dehydrogenase/cyclohydrolase catalytic domain-containing protein [Gammaproteobacteria bacterium]